MRLFATLMLVLAFALVRPMAGLAEGLGPCTGEQAVEAAVDMPCHEMVGDMRHPPSEKPAPAKSMHAGCASACCASQAVMPEAAPEPVLVRQPALLTAAALPAATPVPHAPDLRPPIA